MITTQENFNIYKEWFDIAFSEGENPEEHLKAIILNIKKDQQEGLIPDLHLRAFRAMHKSTMKKINGVKR